MTTTDRPLLEGQLADSELLAALEPSVAQRVLVERGRPSRLTRQKAWWGRHWVSGAVLLMLGFLGGVVHGVNMLKSPDPNDDEATYVSQAWAFAQNGSLSHYTYWYDHPPLGWILLAGWNRLVGLVGVSDIWVAGRLGMLCAHVASLVLVYVVARRLVLSRWASALAVLLYTISPLGINLTRLTLLDNIGTPLVLLGWVFALSPRRRLTSYALAALSLALAVLVKETNALFVLPIVGHIWSTTRSNRRFAVATTVSLGVLVVAVYPLYAALKNELLPGEGHVSLWAALRWQLFERPSGGWVLRAGTSSNWLLMDWLNSDWPLLVGGLVAAVLVFWVWRRGAWIAVTYLLLWATLVRGGYVPLPFPINLLWPAALVIAMAAQGVSRRVARVTTRRWWLRALAALVAAALLISLFLRAVSFDRRFSVEDRVRPYEQAVGWIAAHVGKDKVVVGDNDAWLRLVVLHGYDRDKVVWFYKLDTDPEVQRRYPFGWRDVDYVVSSGTVRIMAPDYPTVQALLDNSDVVATFDQGISILRVRR